MTDVLEPHDAETAAGEEVLLGGAVDYPAPATTWYDVVSREDDRRPIIPAWARSRRQRAEVGHWMLGRTAHTLLYHVSRSPKYLAKLSWYAPIGVWKTAARAVWWARAEDGNWHLRQHAASRGDAKTWLDLERTRQQSSVWRWWLLGGAVVALVVAVLVLWLLAAGWLQLAVAAGALIGLARLGRPADRTITDRVVHAKPFYKLTADNTRRALVGAGVGVKDPGDVRFPRDIFRDPPGQTAFVELPTHVLAVDVIDRREYLAAGFRLPLDQVWPDVVPDEHPGMLQIWVADRPVTKMSAPAWPLLDAGTADFWAPIPYGVDVRMRPITWRLDERNSLFAGVPGSGKSLAARTVALGAVLDPLVVPLVSELKGSGDFDAFEALCPDGMYISGADEQAKVRTLEMLEWLARECDARGPLIKGWAARGYNTDNKLNRRIAEADPRLRPLLAIFDEIQELITDKELGKRAIALITSIVKRGRSLGIHLLLATQRIDKESVPKGVSSNIVNRLCLAVQSHIETDLVLGTGAYSRGARPTMFMPPPVGSNPWAGFGVLAGLSSPVRASYLDNNAAAAVCARAVQLRAGVGQPQAEKVRAYNLAEDCVTVWPAGVAALWLADLLGLLHGLRPDVYGDLDAEALSAALRASRIAPVKVHRKIEGHGVTRAGVRFEHLQAVLEQARLSAINAIPAGQD